MSGFPTAPPLSDGAQGAGGAPLGINSKSASLPEIIDFFPNGGASGPGEGAPQPLRKSASGRRTSVLRGMAALREAQARQKAEREAKRALGQRFRWFLSLRQRQEIAKAGLYPEFKSLFNCHRYAIPSYVKNKLGEEIFTGSPERAQIHSYKNKDDEGNESIGLGIAWVAKCGNPLLCFLDAPKIHMVRQEEIKKICEKMFYMGYRCALVTLTGPHDMMTDPREFVDKFQEAVRFFYSGKRFQKIKERWGYVCSIRANECTDDSPDSLHKSGIHWHAHIIMFFKMDRDFTDEEKNELTNDLISQWAHSVIKKGLCSADRKDDLLQYSCDVSIRDCDIMTVENDAKSASEYLAKKTAVEIAPSITLKNGRLPDRISHWELMTLAFTTRPELIPRALLIMKALKGRAWLYFGNTRKIAKVKEISDEDILEEEKGKIVYDFDTDVYRQIDDIRMQKDIIQEAERRINEDGENQGVVRYLVDVVLRGFDPRTGEELDRSRPPEY